MQKTKQYALVLLGVALAGLVGTAAVVWLFDPYFHFHAPLPGVRYVLQNERYQNDGITRHFTYDALITGTSMTQNFKPSELDALLGTNSIKIPYAGASFKEINDAVVAAKGYNPALATVVRGLDLYQLEAAPDYLAYDAYPTYLYDDAIWNDVKYLWNKDILTNDFFSLSLIPTLTQAENTSFDAYSNWTAQNTFGKETVLANYARVAKDEGKPQRHLTQADKDTIYANVMQNVVQVAIDHPDMTFYYFYPPYSIVYFDDCNQQSALWYEIEKLEYATSILVEYPNIKLHAFFEETDLITDLANYKDWTHYAEEVNSMVLQAMAAGEHQLTAQGYEAYFAQMADFYTTYDYDAIFAS